MSTAPKAMPACPGLTGKVAGAASGVGVETARYLRWNSRAPVLVSVSRTRIRDLNIVHEFMEAGKVTPAIDRRYRLSEVPEAISHPEEGHARGKGSSEFGIQQETMK